MIQWLRLCASNAGGTGSIPGQGSSSCSIGGKKKKKKKERDYDMYKHTQTCAHLFRVAMVVLMVAFNTTFSISLDFSP